jgi:hypothetical protein
MQQSYKPIAALPLFNDGWVFFFFGWVLAIIIDRYELAGANTDKIKNLIFEPYSVGAFFLISAFGFMSVLTTVFVLDFFYKKSTEQIRDSFLLKRVFIPISEVGLSTGAIIIGASIGIALHYSTFDSWENQHEITKTTLAIALMVALIFLAMFWLQRSILAIGKIENLTFNVIGIAYLAVLGFIIYLANIYFFIVGASIGCLVVSIAYYYLVYKNRNIKI